MKPLNCVQVAATYLNDTFSCLMPFSPHSAHTYPPFAGIEGERNVRELISGIKLQCHHDNDIFRICIHCRKQKKNIVQYFALASYIFNAK